MKSHGLGASDLNVSSLGLGCVTFGREIDRQTAFVVLDRAWECGIRLLDTAAAYGDGASETVLGEWLHDRRLREDVVIATKVSGTMTTNHIRRSVEDSLRRLRIDRIDLLQTHTWDSTTPLEETLEALNHQVTIGTVRWLGCSNWNLEQLQSARRLQQAAGWAELISVQPIYNLVERGIENDLLPFCQENGLGVLSYSPLGAGFLTGKYRRGGPVPAGTRFDVIPGHQDIYFTERGFNVVENLRQVARKSGLSMHHLALTWAMRNSEISSILVGARKPQHIDQAIDALAFSAAEEAKPWLDSLSHFLHPPHMPGP